MLASRKLARSALRANLRGENASVNGSLTEIFNQKDNKTREPNNIARVLEVRTEIDSLITDLKTMQYITCAPFYLAQTSAEPIEKLSDQKGDDGQTPTGRLLGVADHIGRTGERGFTIVELIVVVTIISMLSALAAGAYNKVVTDAKQANANALVSTLATAKTAFVTDPSTSPTEIQQFNSDPDASFASNYAVYPSQWSSTGQRRLSKETGRASGERINRARHSR